MPLKGDTRRSERIPDEGLETTPLVTDEARGFLEGRITAEDYSEFVRRHAADEARRDEALHSVQQAARAASTGPTVRLIVVIVLTGYLVVGAILLLSSIKDSTPLGVTATVISGIIAGSLVTIASEIFFKQKRKGK